MIAIQDLPLEIVWEHEADKFLFRLPRDVQDSIEQAIYRLAHDPRPVGVDRIHDPRLTWPEGITLRLHVRNKYRIIYADVSFKGQIIVIRVAHRKDAYRP
jgi:mRNA-degrading endonuclease RelE of RelBE toxin-antitoxin system